MRALSGSNSARTALVAFAVTGALALTACSGSDSHSDDKRTTAMPTPQASTVALRNDIDPCKVVNERVLREANGNKAIKVTKHEDATRVDLFRRRCEFSNGLTISSLVEPKGSDVVYDDYRSWGFSEGSAIVEVDSIKQYAGADRGEWQYDSGRTISLLLHTKGGVTLYFSREQTGRAELLEKQLRTLAQSALKSPVVTLH